jgi:hypothetical protein
MLKPRIDVETDEIPYKVDRKMPTMLEKYFPEKRDWKNFCDNLDRRLRPYEEIKAAWMVIGVVFTLLVLGVIAGIICRFLLVDDDDVGLILIGSLFGGAFLVFTAYFFLMHYLVVRPLDDLGQDVNQFCEKTTSEWDNVELRFERSKSCSVFWDSDFKAWIDVVSEDTVELEP